MLPSSRSRLRPSSLRTPTLIAAAVVAALHAGWAWAVEPFTLSDIRVEGLQRTEPGTVFGSLPFRIGDTYNDEKGAAALRALFATGLFSDVRIEVDGNIVVVLVEERPIVSMVEFVGTKEFDKDVLTKALRDVGIAEGRPFDKALVDRAEQELKRQYLAKSLYGAEVITTITPLERNRVNVTFTVTEGGVAKIREIHIAGAKAFSESRLRSLFSLTDGGWLTWYTKSDRYSRAKLNADLEQLRSFYLNRGYLEFAVESTQVAISPDKQDISITVNIREGQPYVVTAVELEGEYLDKEADFKSLVTIKPGEPYRAEDVAETVRAFTERFGAFGYAFARIEPRTDINRETGRVSVALVAEPQRRVYVRRINLSGNARTRDEVIRREFRQFESSWYDGERIRLSRDRVDRLGYFNEVNVETNEVPGTNDQVDLTLNVVEKPTGNLLLGAGFSSAEKLTLTASIKQDNIFGSGNYLGVEFNTSKYNQNFVISTIDPYFTIDGISRSFDLYYRTTQPLSSQGSDYKLVTPGVAIRFGVPFTEYDTVYFGIGVESTEIKGDESGMPFAYSEYRDKFGAKSVALPLTLGWTRDGRDSALVPTRGRYQRLNAEMSLAGDARYIKTNYQFQQYIPLSQSFTLAFNAELGWGKGLSGRPFPVFKNFTGGGLGSVRGFEQNSFGALDNTTGGRVGGHKRLNLNTELYVPFPGSGTDRTLRLFGYFDVGNVFDDKFEKVSVDNLRASTGIGFSWVSPVGPLKLAYGIPVRAKSGDRIERLQFQIGTAF
ncbi:outer membrane protein assembly factor BamA [Schlegelella sp. S2-27]|uniref:Outer membrane protein assembly factor BamA n=1 Tax=Caldimonas mangrovi TaxID=2944811 RepID=A0ABT0YRX7_9BURK|nr:outer membrane protein assembly factor BamA [Caldimonas mangrovi]MCM5681032.1 outer membrane protein assembly factor BamA [Caldimonas mangrovi]